MPAYTAGIRLVLVDHVSRGMQYVSRNISESNKELSIFKKNLILSRNMLLGGAVSLGVGLFGAKMIKESLGPAARYIHFINQANALGLTHQQIAEGIGAAWKTTSQSMSVSLNEAIKGFLDLRLVLGDVKDATKFLGLVGKVKPIMGLALESQGTSLTAQNVTEHMYSLIKNLEIMGKTQNIEQFRTGIVGTLKDIVLTQGRVTPEMLRMTTKYMRSAKYQLADPFIYQVLPFLIQEYAGRTGAGGGGAQAARGGPGAMLMAAYREAALGIISKREIGIMQQAGFITPTYGRSIAPQKLATQYGYQLTHGGQLPAGAAAPVTKYGYAPIPQARLAYTDPFQWILKVFDPFVKKKEWSTKEAENFLGKMWGGLSGALFTTLYARQNVFLKDIRNYQKLGTLPQMLSLAGRDPAVVQMMVGSQWQNVKTMLGTQFLVTALPILKNFAGALNNVAKILSVHPDVGKNLYVFGASLALIAGSVGVLLIALNPVVATILGITAAFTGLVAIGKKVVSWVQQKATPYLTEHPTLGWSFVYGVKGARKLIHSPAALFEELGHRMAAPYFAGKYIYSKFHPDITKEHPVFSKLEQHQSLLAKGVKKLAHRVATPFEELGHRMAAPYFAGKYIYSKFHHSEVQGYYVPSKPEQHQNLTVVMDHQKVGEIVTKHQATQLSKYGKLNSMGSKFNTNMNVPNTNYRYGS